MQMQMYGVLYSLCYDNLLMDTCFFLRSRSGNKRTNPCLLTALISIVYTPWTISVEEKTTRI